MLEICKNILSASGTAAPFAVAGAMLVAGLLGSVTHCTGMCGPFVLGQMGARMDTVPAGQLTEWRRLAGAALLPYHAGRISTYTLLGVLGGGVLSQLRATNWFPDLAAALMAVAALVFLAVALRRLPPALAISLPLPLPLRRLSRALFADPVGLRGYGLGVMLGFLPCGLVWGALAASSASGSALAGGLGMAAFGLGTVPALWLVGMGGNYALRRWRAGLGYVMPALMISNAAILLVLAGGLMA